MTLEHPSRILSVDPGFHHLGLAVFEGEEIIWYRVKTFSMPDIGSLRVAVKSYLTEVIRAYRPEVLAIEEPFYSQAMCSPNIRALTSEIKTWARWQRLNVRSYTPVEVRAFFCREQSTRQSLAEAMTEMFPFLRRYLTYLPWRQRYWFYVFDAVGLGLMCARKSKPKAS